MFYSMSVGTPPAVGGASTSLRGRQKRQARRHGWSVSESSSTVLAYAPEHGRFWRRHKRHLRMLSEGQTSAILSLNRANQGILNKSRLSLPSARPATPLVRSERSQMSTSVSMATRNITSSTHEMPPWLMEASITHPIYFRRVSLSWGLNNPSETLVLDRSIVEAMKVVGHEHCNDLLSILLDQHAELRLTTPGTWSLMKWISLPLWERLAAKPGLLTINVDLIVAAVPNLSYGLEIIKLLIRAIRNGMDKTSMRLILLEIIFRYNARPFARTEIESVQTQRFHYQRLMNQVLNDLPDKEVTCDIIGRLIRAERHDRFFDRFLDTGFGDAPIETLLHRCPEPMIAGRFFQAAVEGHHLNTVKALLNHFPKEQIQSIVLADLLGRENAFGSKLDERPQRIFDLLILSKRHFEVNDSLIVRLLDRHDPHDALEFVRRFERPIPISPLVIRVVESLFSLRQMRRHFQEKDLIVDEKTLLAATGTDAIGSRKRSPRLMEYLLTVAPACAVTSRVVLAAAQGLPYSVFEKILAHNRNVEVDAQVFVCALRSAYPAIKKIRLLLALQAWRKTTMSERFWIALVTTNHKDLFHVLHLLGKTFHLVPTDSLVIAAWRTDSAVPLLNLLVRDRGIVVSEKTISGIIREEHRRGTLQKFKRLLQASRQVFISSSLIATSFIDPDLSRVLIQVHNKLDQVVISESDLLSVLGNKDETEHPRSWKVARSIQYYIRRGGKLSTSPLVLQKLVQVHYSEIEAIWLVWKTQSQVSLAQLVRMVAAVDTSIPRHILGDLLDNILCDDSISLNLELIQAFEKIGNTEDEYKTFDDYCRNIFDLILGFAYDGDHDRFQRALDRLKDQTLPYDEIERLFARLLNEPPTQGRVDEIIRIFHNYGTLSLGAAFFSALREYIEEEPNVSGRHHLVNEPDAYPRRLWIWTRLLESMTFSDWSVSSQACVFSTQSSEATIKVMTTIGDSFAPCQELVAAAVSSVDAMLKLEFLWQQHPKLQVTSELLAAAVHTTMVDTLDFLTSHSSPVQVTESLLEDSFHATVPGVRGDPYHDARGARADMVQYLTFEASDSCISESITASAVRNVPQHIADGIVSCRRGKTLGKATLIAMLEEGWIAESIYHILGQAKDGLKLLDDPETLSKAIRSEEGRSLLRMMRPEDKHIEDLIQEQIFIEAPIKSDFQNWQLLKHLHRAREIILDDAAMAHLWKESTVYTFRTKEVLFHILDQGVQARMGSKTFKEFWHTCMHHDYSKDIASEFVIDRLPNVPIDIDHDLIVVARTEIEGRIAFDSVLGPDYQAVVHESALVATARFAEELWFHRLLDIAWQQGLVIADKASLLDAARAGAVRSVIALCKLLCPGEPVSFFPVLAEQPFSKPRRARKRILHRCHYFKRQAHRRGRPVYVSPLARGWRRSFHTFRIRRVMQRGTSKEEIEVVLTVQDDA